MIGSEKMLFMEHLEQWKLVLRSEAIGIATGFSIDSTTSKFGFRFVSFQPLPSVLLCWKSLGTRRHLEKTRFKNAFYNQN